MRFAPLSRSSLGRLSSPPAPIGGSVTLLQRAAPHRRRVRLTVGNWLALVICIVLPLPAMLRRIQVEEAELTGVLGDRYRGYQAQTKRLIPGLW
jgi:protein-S-isoprenylcysteine O-methyltransferase Ste14